MTLHSSVDDQSSTRPPVIFDMDGVILKGRSTPKGVYEQAACQALTNFDVASTPETIEQFAVYEYPAVKAACHDAGIDPVAFWRQRERSASEVSIRRLKNGTRSVYDDVAVLDTLAEHRTLGLVTNNRHAMAEFVADFCSLPVAVVRGRDPTPEGFRRRKPEPDYIEDALAQLGVRDALYVGDRVTDVTAATRAGIDGALLRRSHNRAVTLPSEAAYELSSLTDLTELVTSDSIR